MTVHHDVEWPRVAAYLRSPARVGTSTTCWQQLELDDSVPSAAVVTSATCALTFFVGDSRKRLFAQVYRRASDVLNRGLQAHTQLDADCTRWSCHCSHFQLDSSQHAQTTRDHVDR